MLVDTTFSAPLSEEETSLFLPTSKKLASCSPDGVNETEGFWVNAFGVSVIDVVTSK
jgi:hypothetical protein